LFGGNPPPDLPIHAKCPPPHTLERERETLERYRYKIEEEEEVGKPLFSSLKN
jgi:hypothetical protein